MITNSSEGILVT